MTELENENLLNENDHVIKFDCFKKRDSVHMQNIIFVICHAQCGGTILGKNQIN